jgi:galactokinase/mevalonate kinase-like predicted kinase
MGAGGGGWLVFYVNKNKTIFRKKMKELGLIEQGVNFDWEGTKRLL